MITLAYLWLPYMILPIYAGLERLPDSLLEASADLGARPWRTFRVGRAAAGVPGDRRRLDLHVLAVLGDYITVSIVGGKTQMLGNVIYDNIGAANNLPFAAALALVPVVVIVALPGRWCGAPAPWRTSDDALAARQRWTLRGSSWRSASRSSTCRCCSCW